MTRRDARRVLATLLLVLLAAGLAAAAHGAVATAHRVPQSSLPAMRGMPAGVDSGPSPEARRVLESLPDPLPAAERVPPAAQALAAARAADSAQIAAARADSVRIARLRDSLATPAADSAHAAARDTLAAAADSAVADSAQVPVPARVATIADRARGEAAVDSALAASRPADTLAAATPPAAAPDASGCWGVQIGAPAEAKKAAALREAAQSLLLVPMTIEVDHGRHKVRTVRCLDAAAADSLKRRAVLSGFSGAFRFGGGK